jgi:Lipocalin-like domain
MLLEGSSFRQICFAMMSDSDLRQALLGMWRLVTYEAIVDGAVAKPFGDSPHGYLVYTPDGRVFVQAASRERREVTTSPTY